MKHWCTLVILFAMTSFVWSANLTPTPASLDFGSVAKGQFKTLSFNLKNTSENQMVAELSTVAPYFISPTKSTLASGQQISIQVTLSSNAQAGTFNGKVIIAGSIRGRAPVPQAEVTLSATVVPDLQVTAEHNGTFVTATARSIRVHLVCKSVGIATTSIKTQVFLSLNNNAEQKMQDSNLPYSNSGQINLFTHAIPLAVQSMRVRVVTDPDNTTVESNENNNQSVLNLTF